MSANHPPPIPGDKKDGAAEPTVGGEAVTYARETDEWKMMNGELSDPSLRARRADAHRPSFRELVVRGAEQEGGVQLTGLLDRQTEPRFRYSKLAENGDEIRILRLYQYKNPDEPLKADLVKRRLEDVAGKYEALSYCWGTERATHVIQVRDLNATAPKIQETGDARTGTELWNIALKINPATTHIDFKIRKNLYNALRRLRSKLNHVLLWVDAICIDQSEDGKTEKQGQLAMMGRIYNSASNVCIWLGEDDDKRAEDSFRLIREMMNYKTFDSVIQRSNEPAWAQLIAMMGADWFSRRWIIQEIALSRDASVHCGQHIIHWDDFAAAISLLVEKVEWMRSEFEVDVFENVETSSASILIQTLGNVCRKSEDDKDKGQIIGSLLDIETLVSILLGFQASFPRDTIYSVLSLAKDSPMVEEEKWQSVLHGEQIKFLADERESLIENDLKMLSEREKDLEGELRKGKAAHDEWEKQHRGELAKMRRSLAQAIYRERHSEEEELRGKIVLLKDLEKKDKGYRDLQDKLNNIRSMQHRLDKQTETLNHDIKLISILPDYRSSPRDLFVAFVTRSIFLSGFLDIICRHWAPNLSKQDGIEQLPSWISSLSKAPFGAPGNSQGRQNGENFVSCLPHDQRRRYSASGTMLADIKMHIDRRLSSKGPSPASEEKVWMPQSNSRWAAPIRSILNVQKKERDAGTDAHNTLGSTDKTPSLSAKSSKDQLSSMLSGIKEPAPSPALNTNLPQKRLPIGPESTLAKRLSRAARDRAEMNNIGEFATGTSRSQSPAARDAPPKRSYNIESVPELKSAKVPPHRLSGILKLKGFILGKIEDQSDVMRGGVIPGQWVSRLGWKLKADSENWVPDTLWRLLVADRTPQGGRPPQWYKRACLHGLVDGKVSDAYGNVHTVITTSRQRKIGELTTKYFKRVEAVVWQRRIFEIDVTVESTDEEGGIVSVDTLKYFGLGPEGSQVGDVVCILYGCSVPVVLKAAKNSEVEGLYEMVGEAYVHGVMDGEAMAEVDNGPVESNADGSDKPHSSIEGDTTGFQKSWRWKVQEFNLA
ncbi:heterokaryon incompatibility protein-domain-containing protein [Cladorrhinum sp. PSN332]|nr:heterokaryon incompatibility protein-domain-containing protein [Cladorrhinum sp. PSN332]